MDFYEKLSNGNQLKPIKVYFNGYKYNDNFACVLPSSMTPENAKLHLKETYENRCLILMCDGVKVCTIRNGVCFDHIDPLYWKEASKHIPHDIDIDVFIKKCKGLIKIKKTPKKIVDLVKNDIFHYCHSKEKYLSSERLKLEDSEYVLFCTDTKNYSNNFVLCKLISVSNAEREDIPKEWVNHHPEDKLFYIFELKPIFDGSKKEE